MPSDPQRLAETAWLRWEAGIHNREPKALDALDRLLRHMSSKQTRDGPTKRELEVLQLLSHGLTNREAAEQLGLATETVRSHVANVRAALDARSVTHAVAIAWRRGLIE